MTPLHLMTREELIITFGKAIYFLFSASLSCFALFFVLEGDEEKKEPDHPRRWLIQAYGIFNLCVTVLLTNFAEEVSKFWIFRRRYGWVAKWLVGDSMLAISTLIAVVRANTSTDVGFQIQVLLVSSLYSHFQVVGPSTDFGLINFCLRIPVLTAYQVFGRKEWQVYVVFVCMVSFSFFHELSVWRREEKEKEREKEKLMLTINMVQAENSRLQNQLVLAKTEIIRLGVTVKEKDAVIEAAYNNNFHR